MSLPRLEFVGMASSGVSTGTSWTVDMPEGSRTGDAILLVFPRTDIPGLVILIPSVINGYNTFGFASSFFNQAMVGLFRDESSRSITVQSSQSVTGELAVYVFRNWVFSNLYGAASMGGANQHIGASYNPGYAFTPPAGHVAVAITGCADGVESAWGAGFSSVVGKTDRTNVQVYVPVSNDSLPLEPVSYPSTNLGTTSGHGSHNCTIILRDMIPFLEPELANPMNFFSAGEFVNSGTSFTTTPTSCRKGDTIFLAVMHRSPVTVPSGFTLIDSAYTDESSYNNYVSLYSKPVVTDSLQTFTISQTDNARLLAAVISVSSVTSFEKGPSMVVPKGDSLTSADYTPSSKPGYPVLWAIVRNFASTTSLIPWSISGPGSYSGVSFPDATSNNQPRLGLFLDTSTDTTPPTFTADTVDASVSMVSAVIHQDPIMIQPPVLDGGEPPAFGQVWPRGNMVR